MIFILLYIGTESAFGSYLHTYTSFHLYFEKDIAAYLSSVFWFSFAIGRLLWIGSILYGFSVGSIYASAISCTEKHMPITGKRMSCLAVGGSAGDALIPLLVGYSMNSKLLGSISLIFITLVVVVLSSLFFVAIVLYVKHQSKKDKGNNLAVST
jgi:fucose permease